MPLTDFGVSFDPGQTSQEGKGSPGQLRNPVQEAVQTLNVRLPRVFGARAAVPRELMGGAGGMAQFGGSGGMIGQVLAMLAGVPANRSPQAIRNVPAVQAPQGQMPIQAPQGQMPMPQRFDGDGRPLMGGYGGGGSSSNSGGGGGGGSYSGGPSMASQGPPLTYQQMHNIPGQPSAAQMFSQQSNQQPASIFNAPLPVRVVVNQEPGFQSPVSASPAPQYSQPAPAPAYTGPLSPYEQANGGVPYGPPSNWSSPYDPYGGD